MSPGFIEKFALTCLFSFFGAVTGFGAWLWKRQTALKDKDADIMIAFSGFELKINGLDSDILTLKKDVDREHLDLKKDINKLESNALTVSTVESIFDAKITAALEPLKVTIHEQGEHVKAQAKSIEGKIDRMYDFLSPIVEQTVQQKVINEQVKDTQKELKKKIEQLKDRNN